MCDRKRCCCNCDHRIADFKHCDIDGHYVNYSQCFEHWCHKWSGKKYRQLFDENSVAKRLRKTERKGDIMYYLRKKEDGSDRAIYKHHDFSRYYRGSFNGINQKYQGMKVYTCKTLRRIKELQHETFEYCGETFDIYDENGIVEIPESATP